MPKPSKTTTRPEPCALQGSSRTLAPLDRATEDKLARQSFPLVDRVAYRVWRQWGSRCELEELKAVGRAALVPLLRGYDAERCPLAPYLATRVRWAMLDGLRAQSHLRTSAHHRARFGGRELGLRPGGAWSPGIVSRRSAYRLSGDGPTVSAPSGPDPQSPAGDMATVGDGGNGPEAALLRKTERAQVRCAVASLPTIERTLIEGHYLNGRRFDEVARQLGISKGWASRLHHRALGRLRCRLMAAEASGGVGTAPPGPALAGCSPPEQEASTPWSEAA